MFSAPYDVLTTDCPKGWSVHDTKWSFVNYLFVTMASEIERCKLKKFLSSLLNA